MKDEQGIGRSMAETRLFATSTAHAHIGRVHSTMSGGCRTAPRPAQDSRLNAWKCLMLLKIESPIHQRSSRFMGSWTKQDSSNNEARPGSGYQEAKWKVKKTQDDTTREYKVPY